ncbi:DNA double-strand break repair helicase HerA [Sulfurisphaera tokodaii]|uniref:DNA double-strand break repair helicase HerA n=2 Tax=Sulfurisphaera tokodaii TaxID=111955 RepID=HERA_SULTO|nr:DNA double-strand break repair helicase HerA [Sulfurisphaera tokodaii]Q96YR7.1 RecName: Full=DNA double-strand break repair helicase HerA; AltName: Full=StoHerA [Sulfurisphaera tokodaii str. 7]BAB67210.1 bipolar DNA helicase HerA [Sulfurisphaera tokodaii str. 7]HII72939.1 ATP-binding protein [Sulfurisphaera tokodaii]
MIIGYVVGSATTQEANVLLEKKVRSGYYVTLEYDDEKVLGLVTLITTGSPLVDDSLNDIELVQRIKQMGNKIPIYMKAKVKLLCKLDGKLSQPDLPPVAGTPVRLATNEELSTIFSEGTIRIGKLIGSDVEVRIRVNALTRHLAILAATGSGKSNTVAVLSSRLSEVFGSVLIFDYHGEYYESEIKNLNNIEPKINPLNLTPDEFATLLEIRENATIQYRILRRAFKSFLEETKEKLKNGNVNYNELNNNFRNLILKKVDEVSKNEKRKDSKDEVINKIEDFLDRYSEIIDFTAGDVVDKIKIGKVNVINLSSLDEDAIDAIVSHYLRKILTSRKENKMKRKIGLKFPVLVVIEEAHVLLSKDSNTLTKHWAGRIAREGRKFGVGLIIVSQRPKGIDENILSQMTNKIILKMVEPSDKKYVLETSDNLSEDIVEGLSALDTGEAVIVGNIVRMPAIVKIDKFEGKLAGSDPNLIEEWKKAKEEIEEHADVLNWGE